MKLTHNKIEKSRSDIEAMDDSKFKIDSIDHKFKELGFEKLKDEKDSQVRILSTAGDMDNSLNDVYLYYDTKTGKYAFGGNFYWDNDDWMDDFRGHCGFYCMQGDVGGTNGFYIASLHKDINTYYEEFWTLYSDQQTDEEWTNTASTYSSARGYGWEFQDSVIFPNTYNAWGVIGWFYFDFVDGVPTGETVSFKASYGHTWSTDYINSISVGPWSFGFSWGTSNHSWNKDENHVHTF